MRYDFQTCPVDPDVLLLVKVYNRSGNNRQAASHSRPNTHIMTLGLTVKLKKSSHTVHRCEARLTEC